MSGPKKLPPVKLPAVTGGQLPVVAKARTRPVRALKEFADRAQNLTKHHDMAGKSRGLLDSVRRHPDASDAQKVLDDASAVLASYDKRFREEVKELAADLAKFNPEDAYDDDCNITEERVTKHIGVLLSVRHQMHCDSLRRCLVEAPAHQLG
jgi:hypothetical protein